jgi:transposase-like protein
VLLMRLKKRGVQAEQGLQMIVRDGCGGLGKALSTVYGKSILDQRCIFHKLQNVADKVSSELSGKEHREVRREMMDQAALIYEAEHPEIARQRLGPRIAQRDG